MPITLPIMFTIPVPGRKKHQQQQQKKGARSKQREPVKPLPSNKVTSDFFWPTTLDRECDKAARILRGFCKDGFGFYEEVSACGDEHLRSMAENEKEKEKGRSWVLVNIPTEVIEQAKGLAIFTTMRQGLWMSTGSGGSGVLIARDAQTDEWSSPSGIMLDTTGLNFLAGVDVYDGIAVINSYEAVEALKKPRCTVGGEVRAMSGPIGAGALLDYEMHRRQAPVWTYMKSRGSYADVPIDGAVITERAEENERFYGYRISARSILAGKVQRPPRETKTLIDTANAAQGDLVNEERLPPPGKNPSDCEIVPSHFGIPEADDPDPYGVKALEEAGVIIREAGTHNVPDLDAVEFHPNHDKTSPRKSSTTDSSTSTTSSLWRGSVHSANSVDRGVQTEDLPSSRSSYESNANEREGDNDSLLSYADQVSPSKSPFLKARLVTIPRRPTPTPALPSRNPLHYPGEFPTPDPAVETDQDAESTAISPKSHREESAQKEGLADEEMYQLAPALSEVSLASPERGQKEDEKDGNEDTGYESATRDEPEGN